ncbi:MAG TPA: hypothetical protein VGQ81_11895 [Acidobacteriota bacterium]|nr:hypothetical protein [Acidobacteriota bacterium]
MNTRIHWIRVLVGGFLAEASTILKTVYVHAHAYGHVDDHILVVVVVDVDVNVNVTAVQIN